ncbi:hypothetical protein SAMN05443549_101936 [Flavobacterium fluvii]|uniref:Uncharacterized protein n=1 Tax=Flavobacterium fluvii TaxID=468056 RepID=A0A1M5FTP0_9FLAO|nr:hypothetical protein SAMN05443549_101936 [Flavobacterium fluvii]
MNFKASIILINQDKKIINHYNNQTLAILTIILSLKELKTGIDSLKTSIGTKSYKKEKKLFKKSSRFDIFVN